MRPFLVFAFFDIARNFYCHRGYSYPDSKRDLRNFLQGKLALLVGHSAEGEGA
jgi:hypothetical protein